MEIDQIETNCSICYIIMVEPCKTSCNHVMCIQCLQRALVAKMECPMCRQVMAEDYQLQIDKDIQATIKEQNPTQF